MKFRLTALCLMLSLLLLTGCAAAAATVNETHPVATVSEAPAADPTVAPQPTPVETMPQATTRITPEEAKSIALAHAGIAADQARYLECEFELDDCVQEYDVEFHAEKYEYSYSIHAETGEIRSFEKEIDD